jgi:hypothetical protein
MGKVEKTIRCVAVEDFIKILAQWPETAYLASWDMTVQLLDKDGELIDSIGTCWINFCFSS